MAPESPERSSPLGRRYCGMGNHMLRAPYTRVTDRKVLHFAQQLNSELRPDMPLCQVCYDKLEEIYKYKAYNARQHQKRKQAESVSDVSSSQRQANSSDNSSTTSTSVPRRLATATAAIRRPTPVPVLTTLSEDNMPTTSAAAAEKRKRSNPPPAAAEKRKRSNPPPAAQHVTQSSQSSYVSDEDDPNSNVRLNEVNGTRMPHIQPIPKRRQVVHLNKAAMDISLAGSRVHAPESPDRSSPLGRRYCGMGNHMLRAPYTRVTDRKVLHFAQQINSELRPDMPLCQVCYDKLEEIYKYKAYNARQHQKRKQAESVSDVSSSQRQANSSDNSSTTSTSVPRRLATATAAIRRPTPVPVLTTLSEDNMPTTSAAAAEKRKRSNPPPATQHVTQSSQSSYVSDDDDPNSNLSLNAVNGTRLPHIQPIPRRRPTVHLNKEAMDIYLAGTTGG
ncbi:uncharacterized protein LOC111068559 [Drosophila obscura]|uniref:uncharacterized protein LOC111068559 n=1 Tax=Drosophila obscura TaxID=7282 RepID=UPI001BB2ACE9|nr:uncharacterized protein LOC111068559 [Drosophila obscura]